MRWSVSVQINRNCEGFSFSMVCKCVRLDVEWRVRLLAGSLPVPLFFLITVSASSSGLSFCFPSCFPSCWLLCPPVLVVFLPLSCLPLCLLSCLPFCWLLCPPLSRVCRVCLFVFFLVVFYVCLVLLSILWSPCPPCWLCRFCFPSCWKHHFESTILAKIQRRTFTPVYMM